MLLFETVLLLLLLRALGELRQHMASSGTGQSRFFADRGLPLESQAPMFVALDHEDRPVRLEDTQGRRRVLAFVSPGCPACETTIDALNDFLREQKSVAVFVIGGTDKKANRAYAAERKAEMPILTPDAKLAREVYLIQGIPFVYILDEKGVIKAKGIVNALEHLHQLLSEAEIPTLA
ncbi:MAG TPA: redoxin domain-containing protein [Ktedonosporobacter sp.]|nr:redoxin domain-containing protein [Ktedonosporobacter sp.]